MIHTDRTLRKQDEEFENSHYQLEDGEKYQLTEGEKDWLDFVASRYCIYDHIMLNSECDNKENLIYTVDTIGLSEALKNDDGMGYKAVCLSDDSTLQAIFFYSNHN